jgi:acetoin utilization deacetylase AcuC-like enzyme
MAKYALVRERVAASSFGGGLVNPPAVTDAEILRAHDVDYVRRVVTGTLAPAEVRRIGFPWTPELVERSRRSSGATLQACRAAFSDGVAVNLAGGTHHAFRDRGEGYCVFNDAAIAALAMQAERLAARVVVIDCDVHQGDGTAAIFADDPSVFTLSIHGANNFPFTKQSSDLDIELKDGTTDEAYLDALQHGLVTALGRARPDLAIYLAGADPYQDDRLGRLAVSKAGLRERDRLVLETLAQWGIPVAVTMAGGYARHIEDTVDIHFATVETAATLRG